MSLTIPQQDSIIDRRKRAMAIDEARTKWEWTYEENLPARAKETPLSEFPPEGILKQIEVLGQQQSAKIESRINHMKDWFENICTPDTDCFEQFRELWDDADRPWLANNENWQSDDVFAMQRLNGLWVEFIVKCTKLPDNLPLKDEMVEGLLPKGETIKSLIDKGHMFMVNQPELGDYPKVDNNQTCSPISLFFFNEETQSLKPLCVQLFQEPGPKNPIFTPKDPKGTWLAVKILTNNADLNVHTAAKHFLRMHFALEVVYVAMNRNLSEKHPIFQFIKPNFYLMMFANKNCRGDKVIISDNDYWVMKKYWPKWSWEDFNVPEKYVREGTDKIPNFYYRDDACTVWKALMKYTTEMVNLIYKDDETLRGDHEVQRWFQELADPAIGQIKGLPTEADGSMASRDKMALFLSGILYSATVRHTGNTNAGLEYYQVVTNSPKFVTFPIPTTKDDIPMKVIADGLPSPSGSDGAVKQISDIYAVQVGNWNGMAKYQFAESYMSGLDGAPAIVASFQKNLLEDVQAEMEKTAASRTFGPNYWWQQPARCGNSVWN